MSFWTRHHIFEKNSIILVDYTNQLRREGLALEEAVLKACPVRLRPILMTSLACIASDIQLAMGYGPGAETRAPLVRSIIGGMFLSTLVTLIIVPIFYVLFDRFGAWIARQARRTPRPEPAQAVPAVAVTTNGVVAREPELEPALRLQAPPAT